MGSRPSQMAARCSPYCRNVSDLSSSSLALRSFGREAVAQVSELEKKVGLYDLTQFTPKT
jgi:hypothetical protein